MAKDTEPTTTAALSEKNENWRMPVSFSEWWWCEKMAQNRERDVRRFWIASSAQDLVLGLRSHILERRLGEDEKALPLEIIMIQLHEERTWPSFWGEILVKLLNCLVSLHSLLSFHFLRNFHFIFFSQHFQCEGLGNYIKFERSKFPINLFQYRMPAAYIQHTIFEWQNSEIVLKLTIIFISSFLAQIILRFDDKICFWSRW